MGYRIVNYLGFQVGWFASIGGAASGWPSLGPVVMGVLLAVHVAVAHSWRRELALIAGAGVVGYLADSTLVLSGVLSFPGSANAGWPAPLWMVAMWMGLAGTLHASMSWLMGRFLLAAVFGAVSAPVAYAAGVRAGAAAFGVPTAAALAVVAVEWTIAMPLLLWLAGRTRADTLGDAGAKARLAGLPTPRDRSTTPAGRER